MGTAEEYGPMMAVGFTEFGGPEVLKILEVDDPHADAGEVRVKVEAFDVSTSNHRGQSQH